MPENVLVRQNAQFQTEIRVTDPDHPDSGEYEPVQQVQRLTPYGMLLSSLGSCTAILLNSYAQNHGLDLQAVEVRLHYDRNFDDDCDNCEEIEQYEEYIEETLQLDGNLTTDERNRLFRIAHNCPIQQMLEQGVAVQSTLVEPATA